MARYIEIEERDLQKLLSCLQYVVNRYADKDPAMVEFIVTETRTALDHLNNERFGADEATEIDALLQFLSGARRSPEEVPTRRRKRSRRETRFVDNEKDLQALFHKSRKPRE